MIDTVTGAYVLTWPIIIHRKFMPEIRGRTYAIKVKAVIVSRGEQDVQWLNASLINRWCGPLLQVRQQRVLPAQYLHFTDQNAITTN